MASGFLTYRNSRITYYRYGSGPIPVICFHGFGEDGTGFDYLPRYTGPDFTFFAIDLPFHGHSEWNDGLLFTDQDLVKIIEGILEPNEEKWILLGFSLGGRIALSLYEAIPERASKLVLLAPDGLKVNFWYWLSSHTWVGNKFFRFTMKHPNWFFGLLKFLNKLKLVNKSVFKFVNYYIGDPAARELLYNRWTSLRKLKPNLNRIKKNINHLKTPVRLVYGKHDRIILPVVGEKFRRGIEDHCTLVRIEGGHQVLHEKHAPEIAEALLK